MYLFVNPDTGKAPRAHQEGISHRSVTRERVCVHRARRSRTEHPRQQREAAAEKQRGEISRFALRLEPWCRLGTGQENPIPQRRISICTSWIPAGRGRRGEEPWDGELLSQSIVPAMGSSSWEFWGLLGACPAPGTHCRG